MPQLPSGKHVAINSAPLHDLLAHADHFGNVHKILEIRTQTDMRRYIEVYFLSRASCYR